MQILKGGVGAATKFVRRQFVICNRRGKNNFEKDEIIVSKEC